MLKPVLLTIALVGIAGTANALATFTVPEPSSLGLLGMALIIGALVGRKK